VRRRPQPAQPNLTRADADTAYAWGLTLTDWYALTDTERADHRWNITHARRQA
jgi:hypothetical protein